MKQKTRNTIEVARNVLKTEAEAVLVLAERLNTDFARAIDLLFAIKGRVVLTGMGKSGLVGKKIAATLSSTGTPAFFLHPAEAGHGDLGMVTPDDMILAISNSGETEEVICLIPFLKRFHIPLISMTGNPRSTLSQASDVHIDISVKEEACTLGIVPTSSTTASMAMGDAIAVALLTCRDFNREKFAYFHPGGSLGKKLFIKVSDLMHSGDDLPTVTASAPMMKAIIEISTKRLGMTVVTDTDHSILGIITDGDIRRGIEQWDKKFFDMTAREAMSTNPKTISEHELAATALATMEKYSITSLVVPDDNLRPKGIIHLHDILKKGIV